MKTFRILLFGIFMTSLVSCKKDSTNDAPKTKMELLTSKTWVFDEYITNYNSSTGSLVYKKGKTSNSLNLSVNSTKFNSDGTETEMNQNGQTVNGTWQFLNNETQTKTTNAVGTFTSTIITLTENSYIWYDATANNGTYAKMIHP
jgi:hypothetical protein